MTSSDHQVGQRMTYTVAFLLYSLTYDMNERKAAASRGSVGQRSNHTHNYQGNVTIFLGISADHVDVSEQHQTWSTFQSWWGRERGVILGLSEQGNETHLWLSLLRVSSLRWPLPHCNTGSS